VSEQEALERGFKLVPQWFPVVIAIFTAIFTTGCVYAAMSTQNTYQDIRINSLEVKYEMTLKDYRNDLKEVLVELRLISGRISRLEGITK